jgi:hypothetical protein
MVQATDAMGIARMNSQNNCADSVIAAPKLEIDYESSVHRETLWIVAQE